MTTTTTTTTMVAAVVAEAAVGWLVHAVLGSLFGERLEAWKVRLGGARLAGDVERLRSDMRYARMVLAAAEGRRIRNEALARALGDLRALLHDATAVLRSLSGDTTGGGTAIAGYNAANSSTSSGGTAIEAHNTTANSSTSSFHQLRSTLSGVLGKRKREHDHSIAGDARHGSTREISLRAKDIAGKLRALGNDVSDALKISAEISGLGGQSAPQNTRPASSGLVRHAVYRRDAEMRSIMRLMPSNRSNSMTALPVAA